MFIETENPFKKSNNHLNFFKVIRMDGYFFNMVKCVSLYSRGNVDTILLKATSTRIFTITDFI